jgi:hypothetical protein
MHELAPREWKKAMASFQVMASHLLPCDMVDALCDVSKAVLALHGAVSRATAQANAAAEKKRREWQATEAEASRRLEKLTKAKTTSTLKIVEGEKGASVVVGEGASEVAGELPHPDGDDDDQVGEEEADAAVKKGEVGGGEQEMDEVAMSADDFLPVFTFVMIHAEPMNLLCMAELCSHLLDPDEAIAERGYYVASLQAAVNIVLHLEVDGLVDREVSGDHNDDLGSGGGDLGDSRMLSLVRPVSLPPTSRLSFSSTRHHGR